MSDNFEIALNELYMRASAAHAETGGFDAAPLIAVARRTRRARTAAIAVATAAAVVGIGLGGAQAVRLLGDDPVAPPALTPTPTVITPTPTPTAPAVTGVLEAGCGTAVEDLAVLTDGPWRVEAGLDAREVPAGMPVHLWYALVADAADAVEEDPAGEDGPDVAYLVVQNGVVIGAGEPVDAEGGEGAAAPVAGAVPVALDLRGCAVEGIPETEGAPLEPGVYEVVVAVRVTVEPDDGAAYDALVLAAPLHVVVTNPAPDGEDAPGRLAVAPNELVHGVSARFVEGAPLADGDYVGVLHGVDPAAGTVSVDLVVFYLGADADAYVAANVPESPGYAYDGYYAVNDVEKVTTLPIAPDAFVGEVCFGVGDLGGASYLPRTVAQWAAAPGREGADGYDCSLGDALPRAQYYWLRVWDGVVVQVTGQYTP